MNESSSSAGTPDPFETSRLGQPMGEAAPPTDDVAAALLRASLRARLAGVDVKVRLGRYEVGRRLGGGGMGVVYEGFDPELGRDVAIKVLHSSERDGSAALLREAQLLAAFSHPHCVTVFDVGTDPQTGRVWIAMERVEAVDMRRWLRETEPSRASVLDALLQAGSALDAMHRAGLSHGDFKPENVLVGESVVKVADFGLARLVASTTQSGSRDELGSGSAGQTTRGGTPGYMAPEVLAGGHASPEADQFAFCVAAHEALRGRPPYDDDAAARAGHAHVASGDGRLARILRRGLHREAGSRFASMEALLAQLSRAGRRQSGWHRLGAAVGIGGICALGFSVGSTFGDAQPPGPASARAAEARSEQGQPRDAVEYDSAEFETAAATVRQALDAGQYDRALLAAPALVTLAERFENPEDIATAELYLGKALQNTGEYESAVRSFQRARDVAWGADLESLASNAALQLAHLYSAQLGDPGRALREVEMAAAVMRRRGIDPDANPAFLRSRGMTMLRAGDAAGALAVFERGLTIADREGAPPVELAMTLVHVAEAAYLADLPRATVAAERALPLMREAVGDSHPDVAGVHNLIAKIAQARGHTDEARAAYNEALGLYGEARGIELLLAQIRKHLAEIAWGSGDFAEAHAQLRHARALLQRAGGDETIVHASVEQTMGDAQYAARDLEAAETAYAHALRIYEAHSGPDHINLVPLLRNLARLHLDRGHPDQAERDAERGLRIIGAREHAMRQDLTDARDEARNLLSRGARGQ